MAPIGTDTLNTESKLSIAFGVLSALLAFVTILLAFITCKAQREANAIQVRCVIIHPC